MHYTAREAGKFLKSEKSSALENNFFFFLKSEKNSALENNFYTVAEGENFREAKAPWKALEKTK